MFGDREVTTGVHEWAVEFTKHNAASIGVARVTIRRSEDPGKTWNTSLVVKKGPADYSCIVPEPLHDFPSQGGVMWGQCQSFIGVEPVICSAEKANWRMFFSRFNLDLSPQ